MDTAIEAIITVLTLLILPYLLALSLWFTLRMRTAIWRWIERPVVWYVNGLVKILESAHEETEK
jgi:hypothetical protein